MLPTTLKRRIHSGFFLLAAVTVGVSCGSDPAAPGSITADYALSLSAAALTIVQGANATSTVTITRTNFTGAVTLSVGGAPSGVTGSLDPAAPTGTSSTLTVSVGASVAPGTYNLTVDGTGAPGSRSTPLTLTVNASTGGSSNVTVDFSSCPADDRAMWLAYQDGSGAWTRVVGSGDVFTFSITSGSGGVAWVGVDGSSSSISVLHMTQAELTAAPMVFCGATPAGTKTINGTAAGLEATHLAQIFLGGGGAIASFADLSLSIQNVKNGTHDLVGARLPFDFSTGADRAIIRRDQNIADGGSVGTVDFTGSESFATVDALITVNGLGPSETLNYSMIYQVGATCEVASLGSVTDAGASFTAQGIPAAQQRASDFHNLTVSATGTDDFRTVSEYFNALAPRTVTLGATMPAPTITTLSGPYKRLQAAYTQPAAYDNSTTFFYADASGDKAVSLFATSGYLGGSTVTLALADYSGLAGWDNSWAPASMSTGDWSVNGSGSSGAVCTENASFKSASLTGTY